MPLCPRVPPRPLACSFRPVTLRLPGRRRGGRRATMHRAMRAAAALLALATACDAYVRPLPSRGAAGLGARRWASSPVPRPQIAPLAPRSRSTALRESDDGGGGLQTVGAAVLLAFVLGGAILPMVNTASVMNKVEVVRTEGEGGDAQLVMKNKYPRLSPMRVNDKLAAVPVFYVKAGGAKDGSPTFYLSVAEARKAAAAAGGGEVRAATLDEVFYPVLLGRGVFGPKSVVLDDFAENARGSLQAAASSLGTAKRLEPAAAGEGDLPVYQADKLAFSSDRGIVVPVFLSEADLQESWSRLRGGAKGGAVTEAPTVRVSTLAAVVAAMESGTADTARLEFFPTYEDIEAAKEMIGGQ